MQTQRLFVRGFYILFVITLFILWSVAPTVAEKQTKKSLYQRLGGYDAIAAVVDDFIGRLVTDPQLQHFFVGFSTNSKKRIRQLLVDQLCEATGGPCFYIGRDMKSAHAGIGITEEDWQAGVKDLVASLDKFKLPKKEKDEVLALVSSLKGEIVEKK